MLCFDRPSLPIPDHISSTVSICRYSVYEKDGGMWEGWSHTDFSQPLKEMDIDKKTATSLPVLTER